MAQRMLLMRKRVSVTQRTASRLLNTVTEVLEIFVIHPKEVIDRSERESLTFSPVLRERSDMFYKYFFL